MTSVHIHEDDEGMRNLYPAAGFADALADINEAAAASQRNRAPDGVGWTDMHLIAEPSVTYGQLGVNVDDIAGAIAPYMPRIRHFSVGFGAGNPFSSRQTDAQCYGFGNHLYLKLETKGRSLTHIWFDVNTDGDELVALRHALMAIEARVPSGIADYWMHAAGLLADADFVDRYFAALRED